MFSSHVTDLELLLSLLKHELVPNPSSEEVVAHAGLVRATQDIPVALEDGGTIHNAIFDRDFME